MKTMLLTVAVAALVLVNGTASVRAEDTRSQSASGSGSATAVPYFWTENNDAQIHSYFMIPAQGIINPQRTASQAYYLGGVGTASAVAERALD
jgi:hypothetical protein